MSSNSLRISTELFALAREEAELLSRSTAQQIEHWAKIGRAVEAAGLTAAAAKAMRRSLELAADWGLDLRIVSFSAPEPALVGMVGGLSP